MSGLWLFASLATFTCCMTTQQGGGDSCYVITNPTMNRCST
jgi:hypothetical protein